MTPRSTVTIHDNEVTRFYKWGLEWPITTILDNISMTVPMDIGQWTCLCLPVTSSMQYLMLSGAELSSLHFSMQLFSWKSRQQKSCTSNNPVPGYKRIPSKYGWISCSLNESKLNQLRHKLQPCYHVPKTLIPRIFYIGDPRSGQFHDLPIISQWGKTQISQILIRSVQIV